MRGGVQTSPVPARSAPSRGPARVKTALRSYWRQRKVYIFCSSQQGAGQITKHDFGYKKGSFYLYLNHMKKTQTFFFFVTNGL